MKRMLLTLTAFLTTVPLMAQSKESFQPFATVTVGTYVSVDDYLREIRRRGINISFSAAYDITQHSAEFEQSPRELTLTVVTPADLGFPNGTFRDKLYRHARGHGLSRCPAETALALRLAYQSQPDGDFLWIASRPAMTLSQYGGRETPYILGLKSADNGSLWLVSDYPADYVDGDTKLVFVLSERLSSRSRRSSDKLEFRPTTAITFGAWGLGIHTTFGALGQEDVYVSWLGVGTHLFRSRDDRLLAGGVGINLMGAVSGNDTRTDETFGLGLQVMPVSIRLKGGWLYATPTYTYFLTGHPRSRNAFGINFTMLADFDWN